MKLSAEIYWSDGKKLSGRDHLIFLDNDINLQPCNDIGKLSDGRPVRKIGDIWVLC
ncbi:MAG: hypothetical protein KAR20_02530 [Candidatus Heimdallarchaeota archaeon]|nr:hypothetical protein [Candidatus Heimdallarchaeota archaeon]